MTYDSFLQTVSDHVRDVTAWPAGTDKLSQKLRLCYVMVLTYMLSLPADQLPITESDALATTLNTDGLQKAALPQDLFNRLPNFGMRYVLLDGHRHEITEQTAYRMAVNMVSQLFYANTVLFSVLEDPVSLFVANTDEAKLGYVALPAEPKSDTYDNVTFPLSNSHVEAVAQMVAAYISGQTQQSYYQKFHQLWTQIYGTNPRVTLNSEEQRDEES